jgi:hypothetical protein
MVLAFLVLFLFLFLFLPVLLILRLFVFPVFCPRLPVRSVVLQTPRAPSSSTTGSDASDGDDAAAAAAATDDCDDDEPLPIVGNDGDDDSDGIRSSFRTLNPAPSTRALNFTGSSFSPNPSVWLHLLNVTASSNDDDDDDDNDNDDDDDADDLLLFLLFFLFGDFLLLLNPPCSNSVQTMSISLSGTMQSHSIRSPSCISLFSMAPSPEVSIRLQQ